MSLNLSVAVVVSLSMSVGVSYDVDLRLYIRTGTRVVYGQTVLQTSSVFVITMLNLYDGIAKLTLTPQTAVGSNMTTNTIASKYVIS